MDKPLRTPESIRAEISELQELAERAAQADSENDRIAHSLFLELIGRRRRQLEQLT